MINLELTEEEQQTLISVLEESVSDLRSEIVHTERMDFKEDLRRRKTTMVHVLELLKAVETGSAIT